MQTSFSWLRILMVICLLPALNVDGGSSSQNSIYQPVDQMEEYILRLNDDKFRTKIQHFNRERTASRRTFGTGNGAFGFFEATNDKIASISKARIFERIGERCEVVVRFSAGPGRYDVPQILYNDAIGFSIRFRTDQGDWDLLTTNVPVNNFRNPNRVAEGIHGLEENAENNLIYLNQKKDFDTFLPESFHLIMWQYSDIGSPKSWRVTPGYSICAFRLVNKNGEYVNARFSIQAKKKFNYLDLEKVMWINGNIPDYYARDLYTAIERGDYPEYLVRIQIIEPKDEDELGISIFDVTKTWDERKYPWITIGRIVLNKNPKNWYSDIESIALNPMNLISGIEPAHDRTSQSRLFIYSDSHRYRLGINYPLLPINNPLVPLRPIHPATGYCSEYNGQKSNLASQPYTMITESESFSEQNSKPFQISVGTLIARHDESNMDNYSQANQTWMNFERDEKERLIERLSLDLIFSEHGTRIKFLEHARILNSNWCKKLAHAIDLEGHC